jgi:hypothetical protein
VLDPFAGAGTTAVTAQTKGLKAIAFDLSPLSVLATRVKTSAVSCDEVTASWKTLRASLDRRNITKIPKYPQTVERALPGSLLPAFHRVKDAIERIEAQDSHREFFLLGLLNVLPRFSKLIATGGWLSFRRGGKRASSLDVTFRDQISLMIADVKDREKKKVPHATVKVADARELPLSDGCVDAAMTSPPYANRHDYSRVFGVELMF